MKALRQRQKTGSGFTIIELLTIMSIIVILMTILVPGLNKVRIYARNLKQRAQFHAISTALEVFHSEFEDYPDSGPVDETGSPYCGATKLAEAMVGQDLEGFHQDSHFRADCTDGNIQLYNTPTGQIPPAMLNYNMQSRKRYLQLENLNPNRLSDLYGVGNTGPFIGDLFVLSDVYPTIYHKLTADKVGSPILYYKANSAKTGHSIGTPGENVYDFRDNHQLVGLPVPREGTTHPLFSDTNAPPDNVDPQDAGQPGCIFYRMTRNNTLARVGTTTGTPLLRPVRADSYILWSAGNDGLYGTRDDILNFKED